MTNVTVKLYDFTITYGDAQPVAATLPTDHPDAIEISGATWDQIKGYLTFARVDDGSANWNSNEPGVYSWTLTKAVDTGEYNIYLSSNNAKLTIEKIPTTWTTAPVVKANAGDYTGNPLDLLTTLGVSSFGTPEYSIDGGETWATGMPKATAVKVYTIMARVQGDAHNSGIAAKALEGTSTINGLNITVFTAPTAKASLKYTGEAQALVTAGTAEGGTVMYKVGTGEWSATVPTAKDVANYNVSWKIVGDDTHNDKAAVDLAAISIAKADLNILLNEETKPYNGVAYKAADAKFTITGLVSNDEGKVKYLSVTPTPDFTPGVGDYTVAVDATAAKVVYGEGDVEGTDYVALTKNYDIHTFGNTWTITARPIVITAADRSVVKGDVVPVSALSVTGNIGATDEADILAAFKVVNKDGLSTAAFGTTADAYTPARKAAGDDTYTAVVAETPLTATETYYTSVFGEGEFEATGEEVADGTNYYVKNAAAYDATAVAAADVFLANYSINATTGLVKGKLTVTAANLAIIPSINSSIEYNTDYAAGLGYITLSGAPLAVVNDAVQAATTGGKISYEYKVAGAADNTYTATAPTALGSYNVRVVASSVKGKGAYADLAEIECTPAQFSIIPRVVNVVINDVTLAKGSTVETLNAHATVEAGWDANVKESERASLQFNFMFDPAKVGADKVVKVDANGRISQGTAFAADNQAIIAELKEGGAYNGNYDVHFTPGDLIFGASALVLDPADADLATKISEAKATGENYEITFGSMKMNAKEWYALVLPFATTPSELVGKLGNYVVVNRLKSSTIENGIVKVNFGLEMDEIPAGEPILIKAAGIKDGEDYNPVNWNVITGDKKLTVVTGNLAAEPGLVDTDYADFTGTYETGNTVKWGLELDGTTDDAEAKYRWLDHKDIKGTNNWKNPKTNAHTLIPMEAYLILDKDATGAHIFVEDIDENGVTAIKSISADEINGMTVKGMYNLNGMKMNNVPTQKGVYIVNGKKVVIK